MTAATQIVTNALDKYSTQLNDLPAELRELVADSLSYRDRAAFIATSRTNKTVLLSEATFNDYVSTSESLEQAKLLAKRLNETYGTEFSALTVTIFERELWRAHNPEQAHARAKELNGMFRKDYKHPILDADAMRWNTVGFCQSAFDTGKQDDWRLLAWARANGCPWPPTVPIGITTLTVPDGVSSVADDAFRECINLKSIRLPDSITSVGKRAFFECKSLASVQLSERLTTLGDDTFWMCIGLKSIRLPNSITSVGNGAFFMCASLESIQLSEGLTALGDDTFRSCLRLPRIRLPDNIKSINDKTFSGCESLESVQLSNSLTSLGDATFKGCIKLPRIRFPDCVESVGSESCSGCITLTYVQLSPGLLATLGGTAGLRKRLDVPDSIPRITMVS